MRPAVMSHAGGVVGIRLGKELTRKLKELSQREGVTLFMTLLAGYQLLLSRYSGQEDIAVGTDVANRTHAELEGLIGFFVNQLVMRTNLGGNPSVREMLGRVREVSLEAYGHQDLPFERLVEELNPARDLSRSPLFQTMIVLENAPMTGRSLGGLSVEPYIVAGETAKFDMTLTIEEEDAEGMSGSVEYSTELYEAKTIERMLGHWEQLLKQMVGGPEKRIGELELLGEEEREEILEEWNRTEEEYGEKTVVELFEEQVERGPGAVAVVSGQEEVTYGELNRRGGTWAGGGRGGGGAGAWGGGGSEWAGGSDIRGVESAGEPVGVASAREGCRAGGACWDFYGARCRDGGGADGDPEGGWSVRTAGSRISGRAAAVHAGRCADAGVANREANSRATAG